MPTTDISEKGLESLIVESFVSEAGYVQGKSAVGDFLTETVRGYHKDHYAWAKEIWDISGTAYLVNPDWVPTRLVHSPILTDQFTYSHDAARHFMRTAIRLNRNAIFADLFRKLETAP